MKLAEYFALYLSKLAIVDDRIFVLDGDLADSDGAEQFAKVHPDKFIMGGIAEQNLVSMAAGMASCGARPFVFSFAAFLSFRSYDQIRMCLSQAKQPVIIVGSHAGGLTGRNGKSHAALNDLSLMLTLPNIQVWAPADFTDVEFCIHTILETNQPAYVRLPRQEFVEPFRLAGNPGAHRILKPLKEINIVATGLATIWAYEVYIALEKRGIKIGLLHLPLLYFSNDVIDCLSHSKSIITLEDHYELGGIGCLLRNQLRNTRIISLAWPSTFQGESGVEKVLREENHLSTDQIVSVILKEVT